MPTVKQLHRINEGFATVLLLLFLVSIIFLALVVCKHSPLLKRYDDGSITPPIKVDRDMIWKIYNTIGTFGLSDKILSDHPNLETGNLQVKYPTNWYAQAVEEEGPSTSLITFLHLIKSNQSKDTSAVDEPTKNLVIMDFKLYTVNRSPMEVAGRFKEELGYDIQVQSSVIEEGSFNGYPAAYIYEDVGTVSPEKEKYPLNVICSISPSTLLIIETQYFDYKKDVGYTSKTIDEINIVLNTINITE